MEISVLNLSLCWVQKGSQLSSRQIPQIYAKGNILLECFRSLISTACHMDQTGPMEGRWGLEGGGVTAVLGKQFDVVAHFIVHACHKQFDIVVSFVYIYMTTCLHSELGVGTCSKVRDLGHSTHHGTRPLEILFD